MNPTTQPEQTSLALFLEQVRECLEKAIQPFPQIPQTIFCGKLLRPQLCFATAPLQNSPSLVLEAAALECIHTASLLHDDIIDNADTRRGAPTCWRSHSPNFAILSGDLLLSIALELITKTQCPKKLSNIIHHTKKTIYGEILQNSNPSPCLQEYTRIINYKTASLFIASTTIHSQSKTLSRIGRLIGLCWQIFNDLNDYQFLWSENHKPGPDITQSYMSAPLLQILHDNPQHKEKILKSLSTLNTQELITSLHITNHQLSRSKLLATTQRLILKCTHLIEQLPHHNKTCTLQLVDKFLIRQTSRYAQL